MYLYTFFISMKYIGVADDSRGIDQPTAHRPARRIIRYGRNLNILRARKKRNNNNNTYINTYRVDCTAYGVVLLTGTCLHTYYTRIHLYDNNNNIIIISRIDDQSLRIGLVAGGLRPNAR